MSKVTLNTITSGYASISLLNSNFQLLVAAIENTVSRDGTSPNTMLGTLDMNSQRIINLPAPASPSDPARFIDIVSVPSTLPNFTITGTLTAGSVVTPIIGTATAVNTGIQVNGTTTWSFRQTAENFDLYPVQTDATQSIGAPTARVKTIYASAMSDGSLATSALLDSTGTTIRIANGSVWTAISLSHPTTVGTLTATTSVVTPLVQVTSGASLILETTAAQSIIIKTNGAIRTWTDVLGHYPDADNALPNGKATNRWSAVFTPIIDSGTAGSLSLRTNNGSQQMRLLNVTGAATFIDVFGGSTGTPANIGASGETNTNLSVFSTGTGTISLVTGGGVQAQFLNTASATRNITVTGSNGGNPTISTTAGALALGCGQLQFPASQNPSADVNTLDDYEEGTWTPSLGGNTTYFQQTGQYVKIGKVVYVIALLSINAIGTGSTSQISGLPFTVTSTNGMSPGASITETSGLATAVVSLTGRIDTGATTIRIVSRTAANVSESINAIFTSGTLLTVAGFYFV